MASMRNAGLLARLLKTAAADQRLWASRVRIPWFCSSRFLSSSSSPRLAESAPPVGAESAPTPETESASAAETESAPAAGTESAPAAEAESAPVAETESAPAQAASDAVAEPAAKADEFPAVKLPGRGPVLLKGLGKMTNNRAIRDYKRRLCVAKHENERMQYKAITHDRNLPYEIRRYFQGKLSSLPRNSSRVRIRNRCIITGRPRSVYRKFRISRICLRELACHGELMGVYKASW